MSYSYKAIKLIIPMEVFEIRGTIGKNQPGFDKDSVTFVAEEELASSVSM